jgi:hypothetical protein
MAAEENGCRFGGRLHAPRGRQKTAAIHRKLPVKTAVCKPAG